MQVYKNKTENQWKNNNRGRGYNAGETFKRIIAI